MTISPPAKVKNGCSEPVKVLTSGIDSLYLSVYLRWHDKSCFQYLENIKTLAKDIKCEFPAIFYTKGESDKACFNIKPHGANGFEWLLIGKEYSLNLGNRLTPIQRPSAFVQIHSETLWKEGPANAVQRILKILEDQGAKAVSVKVTRVDPCLDMLMPDKIWDVDLIDYRVTRSRYVGTHNSGKKLDGITIGRGDISARLYDKPAEISKKSKKYWMFNIWGIKENAIPKNYRIIRLEFQLRRTPLKELKIYSDADLFEKLGTLWSYCTQKWLKFRSRPGEHHTMRKTFEWWLIVQKGFKGSEDSNPLIREKAIKADIEQLFRQLYGYYTSFLAVKMEELGFDLSKKMDREYALLLFEREFILYGNKTKEDFNNDIFRKRMKYFRSRYTDKLEKSGGLNGKVSDNKRTQQADKDGAGNHQKSCLEK